MLQESAEQMPFSSVMSLLRTLVAGVSIMSAGRGNVLKGPYLFSQKVQKGLVKRKGGQIQGFNLLSCLSMCLLCTGFILGWLEQIPP